MQTVLLGGWGWLVGIVVCCGGVRAVGRRPCGGEGAVGSHGSAGKRVRCGLKT